MAKEKRNLKVSRKTWLGLVVGVLVVAVAAFLTLLNWTVDSETPQWISDAVTHVNDFADTITLNSNAFIVIGVGIISGMLGYKYLQAKSNKKFLAATLAVVVVYGLYLLLVPGLVDTFFATNQGMIDFSSHARDVVDILNTNFQLYIVMALAFGGIFVGYKSLATK